MRGTHVIGSGAPQSSGPVFSGASGNNNSAGQTLVRFNQSILIIEQIQYDTDGYFAGGGSSIVLPKTGYYLAIAGWTADSPFSGEISALITCAGNIASQQDVSITAGAVPAIQVSAIVYAVSGTPLIAQGEQASSANQLVYSDVRIAYLGS